MKHFEVNCDYEVHILPNAKIEAAKDNGKNHLKTRGTKSGDATTRSAQENVEAEPGN